MHETGHSDALFRSVAGYLPQHLEAGEGVFDDGSAIALGSAKADHAPLLIVLGVVRIRFFQDLGEDCASPLHERSTLLGRYVRKELR